MKTYKINEIFYSLQGEGGRAGEPSIFVRFSKCNETCKIETHGFDCDTEFISGTEMTLNQIETAIDELASKCKWLVLTGGEPALQVDTEFINFFKNLGYKLAIETNGSIALPGGIDWITVSPKVAEHALRQKTASEVKYVRAHGQALPEPLCKAELKYISPAWSADGLERRHLDWCIKLCENNPEWRLSCQQHKWWQVR
jgi:organic radical activating enzyme